MDIKLMPEKYQKKEVKGKAKLPGADIFRLGGRLAPKGNIWLVLSLSLLLVIVLIGSGLWGYQRTLTKEKEDLAKTVEDLNAQRDLDLETEFTALKEDIEDLKKILESRFYASKIFEMLEELALPQVQFIEFSADLSENKIDLKTEAIDYLILAKQAVIFEQDSRIDEVKFTDASLEKSGRVASYFKLELASGFLLWQ